MQAVEGTNKQLTDHEARLKKVESNEGKAMAGWAAIVFVATSLATGLWGWAKKKLWDSRGEVLSPLAVHRISRRCMVLAADPRLPGFHG